MLFSTRYGLLLKLLCSSLFARGRLGATVARGAFGSVCAYEHGAQLSLGVPHSRPLVVKLVRKAASRFVRPQLVNSGAKPR